MLALVLTVALMVIIPAYCQGFPAPVISQVRLSEASSSGTGSMVFFMNTTIVNKGTGGNVIICTKLVNASRNSIEGRSTRTLYMTRGETRIFRTTVNGPAGSPYTIVVDAEKKTAFNAG
ncbi:MAG: hypothetical protein CVV32_12075 [Methanomicrobiales archaeon HGW-Methanomicrobiales-3]|nr:MAG: hypothetical protein CVV32_12075 [Methanomicrobiales archaeon HGW-Methanomicrobiales-3]